MANYTEEEIRIVDEALEQFRAWLTAHSDELDSRVVEEFDALIRSVNQGSEIARQSLKFIIYAYCAGMAKGSASTVKEIHPQFIC